MYFSDINECLTNSGGCSVNALCTNTPGSFLCQCQIGYSGNGFTCTGSNKSLRHSNVEDVSIEIRNRFATSIERFFAVALFK